MKKMKKLNLLLGTLLATAALSHAVDSYSDVVGYQKTTFPAGSSLQGVGFVKPPVYSGSASKVSSTSISVSGLTAATGSLNPVNGLPTHYVEVVSGVNEGNYADVVSNNGATIVLDADITNLGSTENIVIRPHTKLSEIFAGNTDLADYSDSLSIFQPDGSSLVFLRDSSTASGWLDASSFNEADAIINPSQGFVLVASAQGTYTFKGTVKKTKTVVPLYAGAVNIVCAGNPSATSLSIQNVNLGANLVDYSDSAAVFSNNGSLSQDYTLLWGGGADGFLDASTFSPISGLNIGGTTGIVVSVGADTSWVVSAPYTP